MVYFIGAIISIGRKVAYHFGIYKEVMRMNEGRKELGFTSLSTA